MLSSSRNFTLRAANIIQQRCVQRRVLLIQRRCLSTSSKSPQSDVQAILGQLGLLARFGGAAYVIQVYIASTTMSVGPSMQPTFNTSGDLLLTEYLSPRLNLLKSGDVVVATKPTDPRMSILKRVRGMPGERIRVQAGRNREPEWVTVPDDHVWLEGDNPRQSSDSRDYGPVPICLIRGKVWARFWPTGQAGWVQSRVIDHSVTAGDRVFGHGLTVAIDNDHAGAKAENDFQAQVSRRNDDAGK